MKYHISKNGEPVVCRAKIQCRMKNSDGTEAPHFATSDAAKEYIEAKYSRRFGETQKIRKPQERAKMGFAAERLRETIISQNLKKEEELPDVTSTSEIIEHWFDGDSKKFHLFQKLSTPIADDKKVLSVRNQKSLTSLADKGIEVSVNRIDNLPVIMEGISHIDIIEDTKVLPDDLRIKLGRNVLRGNS